MPRIARIVIPGCAHHLTQRGNNRQDVFFVDDDRQLYLRLLVEESRNHGLEILAYCLMTNQAASPGLCRPKHPPDRHPGRRGIAGQGFRPGQLLPAGRQVRYAQAVNRLHGRSGQLWQNRFYSCLLDGDHFWRAMRYVERNPVRGKAWPRIAAGHWAAIRS